ncbi:MAG TPA: phosphoribosyl-ATP diphosphatase [Alkalispirochaeta sp.]|nr:phosphoribosyl-ATP diphosphatase [Alkalispirochaeta sp.]
MADTLLIYGADAEDSVVAVAACNEKSRNKSLEQNELWIVDPATGRVLPYGSGGAPYGRFTQRESWWEVRLTPAGDRTEQERSPVAAPAEAPTPPSAAPSASTEPMTPTESVLSALGDVIAERHRTLPEGSYTTHLFTKGPEKIRKKVGEEAVELILAADPTELRSEAADLVYHMMVLLEVEGVRIDEVLAELDRRHRSG